MIPVVAISLVDLRFLMELSTPPVSDKDRDDLILLSVFHFVLAGLSVFQLFLLAVLVFLFMPFLFVFGFMGLFAASAPMLVHLPDQPTHSFPVAGMGLSMAFIFWIFLTAGAWGIVSIILNIVAGIRLRQYRSPSFLRFAAGFNCLNIPFGMILSVFTWGVLDRESVRLRFAAKPS